jgi:hypothetical protein
MASPKTLTIAAVLIAGATSLAMAQNGPPTGGQRPVAGGANGGGWGGGWYGGAYGYGYVYRPHGHLYAHYGRYHRHRYWHY